MATTSNALMHTLQFLLMSTGLLFIAILLTPRIFNFTSAQLPTIWISFRSWLRPPYLYVIINGIIITIAASSRIHHNFKHPHAEPKADEISPIHEPPPSPAGFSFSFGALNLENETTTTTTIGARETEIVDKIVDGEEEKAIVQKDSVMENSTNYDLATASPQPAQLARQETFEIVSSFFQSNMQKPLPSARIGQNQKQATLTSVDETAPFGGRDSRVIKKEKVENYKTAPRKTPSPPPRTAPLARQETSEIVSSFFQSQIEKTSPNARFGQNRRQSREADLVSLDETASFKEETASLLPPPAPAPLARQETSEIVSSFFQSQIEKPPASARFGHHRKPTRSTPEGGKALRVTKPKRSETLESTWKTITEGRHMPLTRHLKKSDTWENEGRQPASSDPSTLSLVKKAADTFTDRTSRASVVSAATAKILKKEPTLSQDELNRRVEAFINKVNEEMRLQRQQSMQQFMDMINRN